MNESFAAIILAAGFSSRMGAFKPLLRLGAETALEKSIKLFRRAGIAHLQVVVGHQSETLIPLIENLNVCYTINPRYQAGMFTSVQCAMARLPEGVDAFFMQPVDIPLTRNRTLDALIQARQATGKGIIHPVFWGKRGHPPLISTTYRDLILQSDGEGGLKALLLPFADDILEIEVPDEHCTLDMDTPADYAYLRYRQEHFAVPSHRECEHLLTHHFSVSEKVAAHSRQVARVALTLTSHLNQAGIMMDRELVRAAALLHDCCRSQADHAQTGARTLRELGFETIAGPVASHMDIDVPPEAVPTLHEVLFLADKLVMGSRLTDLNERFAEKLERFSGQPAIVDAIERRRQAACRIGKKCETIFKRSLTEVLRHDHLDELEG
jgi:putative nucleotidyltransferase with HDIG domain